MVELVTDPLPNMDESVTKKRKKSKSSKLEGDVNPPNIPETSKIDSEKPNSDQVNQVALEKLQDDGKQGKKKRRRKPKATGGTALGTDVGGFTVIGDVNQFRQSNVKRILPDWLANPSVVSCNLKVDTAPVENFGLDKDIVKILNKNFIPFFFPVQQQVIPRILEAHSPKMYRPSDICVSAPTGSGKTLAYALPVIQVLKKFVVSSIRAIIVLPTEILASQVFSVFQTFTKGSNLKVFLSSKRLTLSAETKALIKTDLKGNRRCPFDIIVCTPGRLVDHLENTEGFDIKDLRFLVVDEADRTLDDQEADWLHRLEVKFWSHYNTGLTQPWKSLPLNIRTMPMHLNAFHKLLFSATLSQNPENLEKLHLFQPKLFTSIVEKNGIAVNPESSEPTSTPDSFVGKFTTPSELKESFVLCQKENKPLILSHLISKNQWKRVVCFANTNESTHRLCMLLSLMGNVQVREVSAKWSPHARDMVIKKFIDGQIDILVTSDQLARGIDIPLVDHVISYDVPGYTKTYVHRIGRTARAGRDGQAITLVTREQIGIFRKTLKSAGKPEIEKINIKNSELRPLESKFKEALAQMKVKLEEEEEKEKSRSNRTRKRPAGIKTSEPQANTDEINATAASLDSTSEPPKKKKKKKSKEIESV